MWPVYVINLEGDTARMENAHEQFKRLDIPYERVEGVDGAELSQAQISQVYRPRWWKHYVPLIPAEIGCYLSHLKLWTHVAYGDNDGAFIFEDDFLATDDLKHLLNAIVDVRDWDMVKLYVPEYHHIQNVHQILMADQYRLVDAYNAPLGTLAYGVTRHGARKLTEKYPPFSRPVDQDIARFWESGINIYAVQPSVVTHGTQTAVAGSVSDRRSRTRYPKVVALRSSTVKASYRLHQRAARYRQSAHRRLVKLKKYLTKPILEDNLQELAARAQTGLSLKKRTGFAPGLRRRVNDIIEFTSNTMPDHHSVAVDLLDHLDNCEDAMRILSHLRRSPDTATHKVVSRRHRYLWLRVPKAASSSIIDTIMSVDDSAELLKFTSMADLYRRYPEFQRYFSFAFIRHPHSRLLSCYRDKIQEAYPGTLEHLNHIAPFYGLHGGMAFDDFLAWLNTPYGSDAFADPHWLSQVEQIVLPDGKLPDFVGLFENLEDDWSEVLSIIGMPATPLSHLNPSSGVVGDYSNDLISTRYADDLALWRRIRGGR